MYQKSSGKFCFQSGLDNWVDILATTRKQINNTIRSSTKLTPRKAFFKKNEGYVLQKFSRQTK